MAAICGIKPTTKEALLFTQIENDNKWFKSSFNQLQEKYQKEYVAIKNGKVIENKSNFPDLLKAIESKKENPALILIKFIHEKGVSVII